MRRPLAFDRHPAATRRNLAFDFKTARTIDADGRMHVANTPITKATVNVYYGWEIPGWQELGLNAKGEYRMLRPPEELEAALERFGGIPLLDMHTPHDADDPVEDSVAGSVSAGCTFDGEYVRTPQLSIWRSQDIKAIENEEKRELSCSYGYDPVMEPGVFKGLRYDGRMVNITPNHVALVKQGRAGHDVLVMDNLPEGLTMKRKLFDRFARKASRLLANDADISTSELVELLGAVAGGGEGADDDDTTADPNAMDAAVPAGAMSFLKGKLTDDEMGELAKCWRSDGGDDEDPKAGADDEDDDDDDDDDDEAAKAAKAKAKKERANDAARRQQPRRRQPVVANDAAAIRTQVISEIAAWNTACEKVAPHIGTVRLAMDQAPNGAAGLYRRALDAHRVNHKGVKEVAALEAMVDMLPTDNSRELVGDALPVGTPNPLDEVLKGAVRSSRS